MSVQVSYKNQFVVYIFLLLIFLIVVELVANFWLYNIYRCDFESNEIFKDGDPETNRKLCLESLEYDFTKEKVTDQVALEKKLMRLNSHNIRAHEFTEQKPENLVVMVGFRERKWGISFAGKEKLSFYLISRALLLCVT